MSPRRYAVLPGRGTLLVFSDLHGNAGDLRRARQLFLRQHQQDPETQMVLLGDLVHGPDEPTRALFPELYDYPDESWAVVQGVSELLRCYPERLRLVLGNHDWGHLGGPHTSRFHTDEVRHLERQLHGAQRRTLRELFGAAPLMLAAPCGVLLCHGSPDNSLRDLRQLERLDLRPEGNDPGAGQVLRSILTAYGQQPDVTDRLLDTLGRELGLRLSVVIHGHDRDEQGWFAEYHNQLCPVIFGAPNSHKRYLALDLSARYHTVEDFREGKEILRLHQRGGEDC